MKAMQTLLAVTAIAALTLGASAQEMKWPTGKPDGDLNTLTKQEKDEGWELLFNGEDLSGWEYDRGEWEVVDGVIVSRNGAAHLFSERSFKNCIVEWYVCSYDVAVPKQRFGNSGVFVRTVKTGGSFPKGYEVQVDPYDINNPTGGIYGRAKGTLLVDENGAWKPEAFMDVHEGKWIHQRVMCIDNHFIVWINGEITLDWTDPDNAFPEAGPIALQNHHATDVVLFTDIKVKSLD